MPQRLIYPNEVTDHEARRLAEPAVLSTIVLCCLLILSGMLGEHAMELKLKLILLGGMGIAYTVFLLYVISPFPDRMKLFKWPIIMINVVSVSAGVFILPAELRVIPLFIMILVSVVIFALWERNVTNIFIGVSCLVYLLISPGKIPLDEIVTHAAFFLISVIFVETVDRIYASSQKRVVRLQAINEFVHHVSASIEANEVIDLIGSAIKNALQADTYFLGLVQGDQLSMRLIYDDGEYFPPSTVPLEGSLSGWVIRNQESLFVADFRKDIELEGVQQILMGKDKTSLCWMGVPLHAKNFEGIIAVASYKPNDFNRTDLDLLENLAQQTALVLDNAHHHTEVQAQARLDSLTGILNHGHVLIELNQAAQRCIENNLPLSLIMLDVDHFKQYNDQYGHMVGDQVLTVLSQTLRDHIKSTDAVGRWGGEEFTIVLPGTNSLQAQHVAERVRKSVNSLTLHDREGNLLAFPTVSQGLALFPDEALDVFKLIDLADQRLYTAKMRGRNQMEPKIGEWFE